jgi:hypothetical protein
VASPLRGNTATPAVLAGAMPPEIQHLRDAAERWRARHETAYDKWSELAASLDSGGAAQVDLERRALAVAIKAIDLCISRRVVPRLEGHDKFVTEIVIPPKPRSVASESTIELTRHSHGPVAVECEHGCASVHDALALVDEAQRASIFTRGWAPLFVRLWIELLRTECERTLATPLQKGPRLVAVPDQGDEG